MTSTERIPGSIMMLPIKLAKPFRSPLRANGGAMNEIVGLERDGLPS